MSKKRLEFIIAFLIGIAAVGYWFTKKNCQGDKDLDPDESNSLEFPAVRAHVYFATPEECTITLERVAQELGREATVGADSLYLLAPAADQRMTGLKVRLQKLGESHTRVVITSLQENSSANVVIANEILSIQSRMDAILTGG